MSSHLSETFPPAVMARCPLCRKAIGDGSRRTAISVRVLQEHEPPQDGAIVIECPRGRCKRKLEVLPVTLQAAA